MDDERINASGLEGVNRPTKQFQPFLTKVLSDPETSGNSSEPPGKCTHSVFFRSFRELHLHKICCGLRVRKQI
jgi:hypothetical protein